MSEIFLNKLFDLLIENKKFPNYQAERRIDIFINYFLDRILTVYLQEDTKFICPEFPIKKEDDTNRSTKLDYLCCTDKEIVFVELKTDDSSLKVEQSKIYFDCNWSKCKSDLMKIITGVKNKTHLGKYKTLISTIDKLPLTLEHNSLRILYISPLPKEGASFLKSVKIINPKHINELSIQISDDEVIVWKFLVGLNLYVFEVKE